MIKVINGKRYNTDTATAIYTHWNGFGVSDFKYRHKRLYRTPKGVWFISHRGGAMTDMAVSVGNNGTGGSSDIEPLSDDDAFGFLQAHSDEADAQSALDTYFSDRIEDA